MSVPQRDLDILAQLKLAHDHAAADLDHKIREMWVSGRYSSSQIASVLGQTGDAVRMKAKRKGWHRANYDRDRSRH